MWLCKPSGLVDVRDRLFALIEDLRGALPLERPVKTREACNDPSWGIGQLFEQLKTSQMKELLID
jgi:hypothetical protein